MKDLIIIGASGFGREVAWLVERINAVEPTWNLLGFIDDNEALRDKIINDVPVIGTSDDLKNYKDAYVVCAIGSSKVREFIIQKIKAANPSVKFATLVDPGVEISRFVTLGEGTIICAHSLITVNISIGNHVIINLDCTVGHDAVMDDFVTLYPSVNISGATHIYTGTEIGTGTKVIQGVEIGAHTIVGAGAVVIRNLPDKCTAVGAPAKPIKFFE